MAIFDASWWAVWWPSLMIWGFGAMLLIIAVTLAVVSWRRSRHRPPPAELLPGLSFYLDDKLVMDLYQQYGGRYTAALSHEVEERITNNREFEGSAILAQLKARGKLGVNKEVFKRYIEEDQPITVIGMVIDVLDRKNDIVDVDLLKAEVTASRAALKGAPGADDRKRATVVRLSKLKTFVSISGQFCAMETSTSAVTFEAPYGGHTGDPSAPAVHLTCRTSGLRRSDVPTGTFPASCLGRVVRWDSDTRRLIVLPIAIFS